MLKENNLANIVFMVNTSDGYDEWIAALGMARIIPAFPGAGGKLNDGVVYYQINSKMVQPTTIGEIGGVTSPRLTELAGILEKSGFPTETSPDMDGWQKTHVAMMCPLVNYKYMVKEGDYESPQRGLIQKAKGLGTGFLVGITRDFSKHFGYESGLYCYLSFNKQRTKRTWAFRFPQLESDFFYGIRIYIYLKFCK